MSIAAAYLVSEGVVLGSDSTTTISMGGQSAGVLQLLNHSQKLFEVGENSRMGVCTWGAGSVGNTSHRTVVARLAEQLKEDTTVEETAKKLSDIVVQLLEKSETGSFVGYYVGGWNPQTHDPACVRIEIQPGNEPILTPLELGRCFFSGMPGFFSRVFWGFDPLLRDALRKEIGSVLPQGTVEDFDKLFNQAFEKVSGPLAAVGYQDLPIREAIDFVYSYLHITVKATKFKFGAISCGGPIEVGFITTDRSFRWARHKDFDSAIKEQEG